MEQQRYTDAQEIWRRKTDEQVLEAYRQLADYEEEGQRILTAEMARRGLSLANEPGPEILSGPSVIEASSPIAKLWYGGYSLPVAFWLWGLLGSLACRLLLGLLFVASAAGSEPGPMAEFLFWLLSSAYGVMVLVGIWRSASRYHGREIWAVLAKVFVSVNVATAVGGLLAALLAPA